jgi:hypothetical protein
VAGSFKHGDEPSGSTRGGEFFNVLSNRQFPKDSAQCSHFHYVICNDFSYNNSATKYHNSQSAMWLPRTIRQNKILSYLSIR